MIKLRRTVSLFVFERVYVLKTKTRFGNEIAIYQGLVDQSFRTIYISDWAAKNDPCVSLLIVASLDQNREQSSSIQTDRYRKSFVASLFYPLIMIDSTEEEIPALCLR